MKVLRKQRPERGLWLDQADVPKISPTEVLVKVSKTAICGTDLHIYRWDQWSKENIKTPIVVGHEFVGTVTELGSLVEGLEVGDRVSAEGHITCTFCRNCRAGSRHLCRNAIGIGIHRQGAFAEYIAVPSANIFKVPTSIEDNHAAIFDPLGNAVHTALSFDLVGEDVLITGAGPIGLMACAVARHVGARHVVVSDINPERLKLAELMGASRAVNVAKKDIKSVMNEIGIEEGFDVGLEMSGNSDAFSAMLSNMNHGGRIAILGLLAGKVAIDWSQVIFKGLILKGVYGREVFETWYKMSSMLQSGLNIAPVITHSMPFTDFEKGFDLLDRGEAAKVILDWTGS